MREAEGASGPRTGSTAAPPAPAPASPADPVEPGTAGTALVRGCERSLDLAVVVLASWTLVYHCCLLLRLSMVWAVALETVGLVACAAVSWRSRRHRHAGAPTTVGTGTGTGTGAEQRPARLSPHELAVPGTAAATGTAAAGLFAVDASWPLVVALWLVSAVAGTVWAWRRLGRPAQAAPATGRTGVVAALAWGGVLAVASLVTLRPNPDDLYYVNLSQWVVDHGTFPLRDTIFSDQLYPMSSWPPVASYDALVGTLAALAGVPAGTVAYLVVPPVATFLSVLALWQLLAAWRVRAVALALTVAIAFLLLDGGAGYAAPGTLFFTRLWQGKVILLCLLIPVLLVYALRYVDDPSRRRAGWLLAGGVAAVGLTTSAMFLVPLVALAGAAPLVRDRPGAAVRGFGAMAAYPLGMGVLTVAVGGRSADVFDTRRLYRFDPEWFGHEIFRSGPVALVGVGAVLAGSLLVPDRRARVTTGLLAVITGISFVPGVTDLSYDWVGLGPTLWRISWVASIAALVGVLGAHAATRASRHSLQVAVPLALVLLLGGSGLPIWSERGGVLLEPAPHWQRSTESLVTARMILDLTRTGDVVLAPQDLAITVTVLTTRVKTVAPRDYFMDYLRDDPAFDYDERLTLTDFANSSLRDGDGSGVARALARLDVDQICLPTASTQRIGFVRALDYRPTGSSAWYRCLGR